MSGEKVRRTKIDVAVVEAKTGWRDSKIIFQQYMQNGELKEVVISIEQPYEVTYIREQLRKIVSDWKKQLQGM